MAHNKKFLDTSVARPMLLGSKAYKKHFSGYFGNDPLYVSPYVQMEFKRSYLINVIDFYFVLRLDSVRTIDDALKLWSNKFRASELKAIVQLMAELNATHRLKDTRASDKAKALHELELYIMRIETKLRLFFRNTGTDSTRCKRADIPLKVSPPDFRGAFKAFLQEFQNVVLCRSKCRIDHFILKKNKKQVSDYVKKAKEITVKSGNQGFIRIAQGLETVISKGALAATCKLCGTIGDAVITLDAPPNMELQHTDNSFNQLCSIINRPHHQHPSEQKIHSIKSHPSRKKTP